MRRYASACREWQVTVLLQSMIRHCRPFALHVLAWDWKPEVTSYGGEDWIVTHTTRDELLARHPHLGHLPGPPRRPTDEVCSVRWRWYADLTAAAWERAGGALMCLDGDVWFWASPEDVWHELEGARPLWALTEHRFPYPRRGVPGANQDTHGKYGRFNGGWAWFRDPQPALGVAALTEAWCYGTFLNFPDGRPYFGDQGALDRIHEVAPAYVLEQPGVNLAPWNLRRFCVTRQPDGGIWVSEPAGYQGPLVLYHYSSLRMDDRGKVVQFADPGYAVDEYHVGLIYPPYIEALREVARR